MASNWDAIVMDDYKAVMPLPWKRKWGIHYLYQPAFIQQGGIFSVEMLDRETINSFIVLIKHHFRFAELTLNYGNVSILPGLLKLRTNYILSLQRNYEELYKNYLPSFTKSLRRIRKFGLIYEKSEKYKNIIALYKKQYGQKLPFVAGDYKHFEKICSFLLTKKMLHARIAYNGDKKLLAAVILLCDGKRLYNIISCITEEGKKVEANYFLYDGIIREFAGAPYLLDLEGSDVKGIAGFYKKFNPELQPYPFIKFNNLPPIIKLLKK